MANIKYQIFLSSTFEDLRAERGLVVRAILEMGHIPVGMEMFSAADEEQWKIISRQIAISDYYVVLIAHRYGSTNGDTSFTEKEYDFALRSGIPVLAFVIEDGALWPAALVDTEPAVRDALFRFKSKARQKYVTFWSTPAELYGAVPIALMKQMAANPRIGWIRANETVGPEAASELARLSRENADLRRTIRDLESQNVDHGRAESQAKIAILERNKVDLRFWFDGATDWSPAKPVTLHEIFRLLGPDLMVERTAADGASYVGMMLRGEKRSVRKQYPIPRNTFQSILTDLATLGLVEPSKRKHLAKDTNEYWTLTDEGRSILQQIRRTRLEAGVGEAEEESKKDPPSVVKPNDEVAR